MNTRARTIVKKRVKQGHLNDNIEFKYTRVVSSGVLGFLIF